MYFDFSGKSGMHTTFAYREMSHTEPRCPSRLPFFPKMAAVSGEGGAIFGETVTLQRA